MQKHIIKMETKDEVSQERFLELFYAPNTMLKDEAEGFINCTLTKDLTQNKWVERIRWESMQNAQAAFVKLPQSEIFQTYCSILKDEEMLMFHRVDKA